MTQERINIYLKDSGYWDRKIDKKFNKRNADIAKEYISGGTTLKAVGKSYGVSPERVRQVVARVLGYIWKNRNQIMHEPIVIKKKEEKTDTVPNPPFTEKEFKEVREYWFRGDSKVEISKLTGRSYPTIMRAINSDTWEEYLDPEFSYKKKKHKTESKPKPPVAKPAPSSLATRYSKLSEFRSKFDEVLIDFIAEEIEILHGEYLAELLEEKKRLEEENKQLQVQIANEKPNTFIQGLQSKLHPTIMNERKVLPQMYTNGLQNRLCFLAKDIEAFMSEEEFERFTSSLPESNKISLQGGEPAFFIRDVAKFRNGVTYGK